jgi:hypothetical protein
MTLYIPRVYKNVSQSFIINVFEDKIRFGKIRSVHMVKIPLSKNNYSAVIQFESWNETIVTTNFQTRIFKQGFARVVHDDPWYWIVTKNQEKDQDQDKESAVTEEAQAQAEEGEENVNQIEDSTQHLNTHQELFGLINSIIVSNMKKIINN